MRRIQNFGGKIERKIGTIKLWRSAASVLDLNQLSETSSVCIIRVDSRHHRLSGWRHLVSETLIFNLTFTRLIALETVMTLTRHEYFKFYKDRYSLRLLVVHGTVTLRCILRK